VVVEDNTDNSEFSINDSDGDLDSVKLPQTIPNTPRETIYSKDKKPLLCEINNINLNMNKLKTDSKPRLRPSLHGLMTPREKAIPKINSIKPGIKSPVSTFLKTSHMPPPLPSEQ
jgi:hypothetical protein